MTHMYDKVAELVLKYHAGEISEEEIIELNNIRLNSGLDPKLFEELLDVHRLAADLKQMKTTAAKPLPKQRGVVHSLVKYAKIAAVAIPILVGIPWLLLKDKWKNNFSHATNSVHVIIDTIHYKPTADTNKPFVTFIRSDLQHVLRQLSQDPELEVIYPKGVTPIKYTGELNPSRPYDEFAQDFLKFKGYKSTFKGKKIIVHS